MIAVDSACPERRARAAGPASKGSGLRAPPGGALPPRGFTLLEVMVSLGILVGALLAISDVVSGALRNHVRARNLEVATLLARGKLAALEDHYEQKGFRTSDENDEGAFEEEGHPEIRWQLAVTAPPGELGPDTMVRLFTQSERGLKDLLPSAKEAPALGALQTQLAQTLQAVFAKLSDQVKKGVRQVRLTVSWPEAGGTESFEVTTHMLVLAPAEGLPQ